MPSNQSNYGVAIESIRQAMDKFLETYRIMDAVLQRAKQLAPTHRIQEAIDVEYLSSNGNGTSSAKIIVDLNAAPEARAYEYGSGEHARRGNAQRYPIVGNPILTFYWERLGKTVNLGQVMHPGVASKPSPERGYIATAIQETKADMNGRIQKEFGSLVSESISVAFRGS